MTQPLPSYQLTRHPIGSLREIWAVSWPLMLGLLSASLMFLSDRLILAKTSMAAMNGATNGGVTTWAMLVFFVVIAEATEVFVGKYNGEGSFSKVGRPVWQMLWMILLITPLYWIGARVLAPYLFYDTGNTQNESDYFIMNLNFAPCFIGSIALASFFIGTGRMRIVTYTMLMANFLNIALDFLFVFGFDMGCKGAALGTGLSQAFQMGIYFVSFFSKSNREKYGTTQCGFDFKELMQCLKVAVPSAIGRINELAAHVIFFRIMIMSGPETVTCVSLVQAFFLGLGFMIDGLMKGSTAIISNLFGANQKTLISKVIRSSISLHAILYVIISVILLGWIEPIAGCFFSAEERILLHNSAFLETLRTATFWMTIYFLFDGCCWVFFGLFTAANDTKFVMYVNLVMNWVSYILPVYIVVKVFGGNAAAAWMVLAFYNCTILTCYYLRYRTKIAPMTRLQPDAVPG